VKVRALAAADRDAVAAVIASDETFKSDEFSVALELVDLSIAGSSDYEVRVADDTESGGVCGYICFGRTPMTERTYDLYWICVHARARGKGVARLLVEAMEGELRSRGGGQIRVETSATDGYGTAQAVYARLGYPEASRLPDFYSPGDALITYYKVL
jgi:ribosomal protein S18 acetylase RimI-like enzyme